MLINCSIKRLFTLLLWATDLHNSTFYIHQTVTHPSPIDLCPTKTLTLTQNLTLFAMNLNLLSLKHPASVQTLPSTAVLRVNDPLIGWRTRPIHDLVMIRGAKGYSWLHWGDGSCQIMAYTLKRYEQRLPASQYVRVHQNCLINRDFVQKIQLTHKGPQLYLSTGERIMVSRRRWMTVKRALLAHLA
jgi:hypothetical protein